MNAKKEQLAISLPLIVQQDAVLVDARLLHQKLQSGYQFSDWIKARINEFGFTEGQDYYIEKSRKSIISEISEITTGKRKTTNYHLTLDMAKELAMLERNEIGRQVRRYFIAKEKEVRGTAKALPAPASVFKGLKPEKINNRLLYPYREVLVRCGYTANNNGGRAQRYPQHFVKYGKLLYTTEEFASHLYHQRQLLNNRTVLKNSQPVLPLDFGQQNLFLKGGVQ